MLFECPQKYPAGMNAAQEVLMICKRCTPEEHYQLWMQEEMLQMETCRERLGLWETGQRVTSGPMGDPGPGPMGIQDQWVTRTRSMEIQDQEVQHSPGAKCTTPGRLYGDPSGSMYPGLQV